MKSLSQTLLLLIWLAGNAYAQRVVKVTDINPSGYAISSYITIMNNRIFFSADDGVNGRQLWISDGTAAGTHMLKKINAVGDPMIFEFKEYRERLYFSADNGIHGQELWVTDGTEAGTVLFKDIRPNADGSVPGQLHVTRPYLSDSILLFTADDGVHGRELWQTDGTAAGTRLVQDINPGAGSSRIGELANYSGNVYFACDSNPPPPGTSDKPEPWMYNGIWGTCRMLKDINPGPNGSSPRSFTEYNALLHFTVNTGNGALDGLWSIDGVSNVKQVASNISVYGKPAVAGNKLFFRGFNTPGDINNIEPWISDGTAAGTKQLKEIYPGSGGSGQGALFPYKNQIVFPADDGVHGIEPWISDGTAAGTRLLKDISAAASSNPAGFIILDDLLYFWVKDDEGNYELYQTDGTEEHTLLVVKDIPDVSVSMSFIYNNTIYFLADGGELHYIDFQANKIADAGRKTVNATVYPNPAEDHIMVSYGLEQSSHVTIRLKDIQGRNINGAIFSGQQAAGTHNIRLDLQPGLPAGLYFLDIVTDAGIGQVKVQVAPR